MINTYMEFSNEDLKQGSKNIRRWAINHNQRSATLQPAISVYIASYVRREKSLL